MSVDPMDFNRAREAAVEAAEAALVLEEKMSTLLERVKELPMSDATTAIQQGCDTPERAKAFSAIWNRILFLDERFAR